MMTRLTLRITEELHERPRWLAFAERRSQQMVVLGVLERFPAKVEVRVQGW